MSNNDYMTCAKADGTVTIKVGDTVLVANCANAVQVNEADYLPRLYFPPEDVNMAALSPSDRTSHCPHKGDAVYFHLSDGEAAHQNIAWSYPDPLAEAADIKGMIAFYEERLEVLRS